MPALAELVLTNFQSHRFSVFDFHPNLNALIGPTNNGKSSVERAIDFFTLGLWSKSFIRTGETDVTITGRTVDGDTITRIKGTGNKAIKTDANGKVDEYSGFGDTLPIDIIKALGTPSFKIDQDKSLFSNISRQHDAPFLLKEVGSFRAKILGRLSGLHLIDIAIRNLNSDSKNAVFQLTVEKSNIESAKKELEKYDGLANDIKKLEVLKAEVERQQELRKKCEKISLLIRELDQFNSDVKSTKEKKVKFESINLDEIKSRVVNKLIEIGVCPTCKVKLTSKSAESFLGTDV